MTESGDRTVTLPAGPPVGDLCPYLMAAEGGWRSASASREHRCTAVRPATVLAAEKQRRLCLTADHVSCSTYVAAAGLADADGWLGRPGGALARPLARTTPVVLDHSRSSWSMPAISGPRGTGQGGLVAVMALAFGALVAARLTSGGPDLVPTVGGDPTSSPASSVDPASVPPATVSPSATSAPVRTLVPTEVEPTPEASPTPAPSTPVESDAPTSYTVARGDTLSTIAGRNGTTWQILAELNGISDPRSLRVGQVLQLP